MRAAPPSRLECRELPDLAAGWLEGALAPGERRRVERHLAGCADCRAYLGQVRAIARAARRLSPPLPARARARVLLSFRAWRRGRA